MNIKEFSLVFGGLFLVVLGLGAVGLASRECRADLKQVERIDDIRSKTEDAWRQTIDTLEDHIKLYEPTYQKLSR